MTDDRKTKTTIDKAITILNTKLTWDCKEACGNTTQPCNKCEDALDMAVKIMAAEALKKGDNSTCPITITWRIPECFDGFVNHKEKVLTFDIPFSFGEEIYYAYKKGKKWVLLHSSVDLIALSNTPNIRLKNGMWIDDSWFDRVFPAEKLKEAQEYCINRNQRDTVKIIEG